MESNKRRTLVELYDDYRPSIVRITVRDSKQDLSNGTGFHIGEGVIVTARHVVEGNTFDSVTRIYDGKDVEVFSTLYPGKSEVDLCLLITDFNLDHYMEKVVFAGDKRRNDAKTDHIPLGFHLNDMLGGGFVLTRILLMGFPLVPQSSETRLLAVTGEVNAQVDKYTEPHPHFVVSTVARGGFSGGPVISEYGWLLGVLTESLFGNHKPEETGFAAAVTIEPLLDLLAEHGIEPVSLPRHLWKEFCRERKKSHDRPQIR